jgi:hypothetical protein
MNGVSDIELRYTDELAELLRSGDKELLKSHHWDKEEIEKRITFVSTFFPELKGHKVSILFSHNPNLRPKPLGTMYPRLCPIEAVGNLELVELSEAKPEAFIINFWSEIFSYDEIDQLLNYSHEFQHVVQYLTDKRSYWLCRIMFCLVESMQEEELPTEIDAERASKRILEAIYGKQTVDDWVNRQLDKKPHSFFIRFGRYEVDAGYDLRQKTKELWEINHLEDKIKKLRRIKAKTNKEQRIIKMYDKVIMERSN